MISEEETKMHACRIPTMIAVSFMLFGVSVAVAQSYPTKPIRLIVAWGPGGAPDIFARIVGQKLYEQISQPVIVDNRPGATGNIGAGIVASAPPDGYTIFNATLSLAISPSFYKQLPFDPVASFTPVTMLASVPLILVINPRLPAKSVPELIAFAKSKPGSLNYSTVGNGSPAHVSAELFQYMAKVKLVHVPYKSGGEMVTAILSGEAQLAFPAIAPALPHVKAGRLHAVAITARKRSPVVPDVPTFAEAGLPEIEADNWNGIVAPAGTPKSVINKLHAEIVKAARAPEVAEQFARQGAEANLSSPAEFSVVIKAEVMKWAKVVRAAGIEPQ
jgi:tripartite-type tricarboxylate transporter receptor subunit TctC